MERLARVEVLDDRLRQVGSHHPRESHFREGRELFGHSRVRILAFIFELQRRPDALEGDRGARPRRGGPEKLAELLTPYFLSLNETCPYATAPLQ